MRLVKVVEYTAAFAKPEQFGNFRRHIPVAWILAALLATGAATVRRRRLLAEEIIWLVVGMALFRDRTITDVVDSLELALPGPPVAPSAIVQARARLGAEPMEWLFNRTAEKWAHESAARHRWRGLALYSVDGTALRVPDSDENRLHYGTQNGRNNSTSGYPLVRAVALMGLRSHLLAAVRFGPYGVGERTYAKELWDLVPDDSLMIVDRNFVYANTLIPLHERGRNRHWLVRARARMKMRTLKKLGRGDELIVVELDRHTRQQDPSLPAEWTMRAVRYQRPGYKPQLLLTSLLDKDQYPASELTALYHERWEIELGYDEIKTEMLEREEAIRSRTVEGVQQELWGLFLAYNLVRAEMERVAAEADVEPTQISFVTALRLIRDEFWWGPGRSPGAIPQRLRTMREKLQRFILPPRRERTYPREVKLKMSNYALNRRRRAQEAVLN